MTLLAELAEKIEDNQWEEWKGRVLNAKEEIVAFGSTSWPATGDENTTIPVPRLISWGLTEDSPQHFGPFMVSDFVEGIHLSDLIVRDPADTKRLHLNPQIDRAILDNAFSRIAEIMLQLYNFNFDHIGATSRASSTDSWSVAKRPLTYSMNELATTAFYPVGKFPAAPLKPHLWTQRNLCGSQVEARDRYISRHLFAHIKAVLDLEFTNTMPSQYASDPPWWLLLVGPYSYMLRGRTIEEFVEAYEPRLEQFLQAMEGAEKAKTASDDEKPLSCLVCESWTIKHFWFDYAVRKPFDVEVPPTISLDEETLAGVESFIEMKMTQLKAYDNECARIL
ncbi:hypothetical protein BCR34DRAFT_625762 [Clohesyomyces aquaticus]|uniref:Uncharacterized protein n=1 Tax=Clohesyomyces aquaticus TaxID=1231657 RepID=A0A1Y1ZGU1_9PLEO|nr:hypothetical protein BCR34DRAFT_625762 [Clohesyomyces aquaticus]